MNTPTLSPTQSLMIKLAALVASCTLMAGCGGGSGADSTTSGSQSVTPSTPSTTIAVVGEAASGPASAPAGIASAAAADEAASAPAAPTATAANEQDGEAGKTSAKASAAAAAATATSPATGKGTGTSTGTAPSGTSTAIAPAAVIATPPVAAAPEANAMAEEGPSAKAMAAGTGTPCSIDVTRGFGSACFAAATTTLADGASKSFPNVKPGYRGSTKATCRAGTVTWSQEICTAATLLSTTTAGITAAAKQATSATTTTTATTATAAAAATPDYNIGVYYFGGWKNNQMGASSPTPWAALKRYADREPLLGYYAEDSAGIMSQQLKWMRDYGIDFVVFNWYWARHNEPMLDHAVKAYLAVANKPAVKFAVQWSNHTDTNFSRDQLDAMFKYWVNNYFKKPEYQRYDGKPVVYIFLASTWARNAAAIGMTSAQLIERLNNVAKAAGLPGVSVIGGIWGGDKTQDYGTSTGFAAFTMYNYHSPANIPLQPARSGNYSRSYAELHQSYANQWDWMIKNTKPNFIVPMSSGWDNRPWGGSKDPLHDDSRSLPAEFALHLQAAKAFMESNPVRTQRTAVVCCWNEFGEGSFIEPTKVDGTKYLEPIRDVFGTK